MPYTDILYETDGRLAFVTLNRPEKTERALPTTCAARSWTPMREAESDDEVGVIVLRGAGRSFSAGYDLSPARAATSHDFVSPRSGLPDTGSTHPGKNQVGAPCRHDQLGHLGTRQAGGRPDPRPLPSGRVRNWPRSATFRICADNAQVGYPPVRAMTTMDMMWTPWHLPPCKAREFAYVGDSFSG